MQRSRAPASVLSTAIILGVVTFAAFGTMASFAIAFGCSFVGFGVIAEVERFRLIRFITQDVKTEGLKGPGLYVTGEVAHTASAPQKDRPHIDIRELEL